MSKARGPYRVDPLGHKKKAQQALDKKAENARELGLDYEPVQQPVAVFREVKVGEYVLRFWPSDNGWMCGITSEMMQALAEQPAQQQSCYCPNCEALSKELAEQPAQQEPVTLEEKFSLLLWDYQELERAFEKLTGGKWIRKNNTPQRTWVGLTDEEYIHITDSVYHKGLGLVAYYKAIEAKLKEKNT